MDWLLFCFYCTTDQHVAQMVVLLSVSPDAFRAMMQQMAKKGGGAEELQYIFDILRLLLCVWDADI